MMKYILALTLLASLLQRGFTAYSDDTLEYEVASVSDNVVERISSEPVLADEEEGALLQDDSDDEEEENEDFINIKEAESEEDNGENSEEFNTIKEMVISLDSNNELKDEYVDDQGIRKQLLRVFRRVKNAFKIKINRGRLILKVVKIVWSVCSRLPSVCKIFARFAYNRLKKLAGFAIKCLQKQYRPFCLGLIKLAKRVG